jgi:hypothetical protein
LYGIFLSLSRCFVPGLFTYLGFLVGSSAMSSVVGAAGVASAAPVSAGGALQSSAASAVAPPLDSGPWWGVLENPCSSLGYLGEEY